MADKIFISYRRNESSGHAGRVRDRLEQAFGVDLVFMDVDSIPLGLNFVDVLRQEVESSTVLLAMMGRGWLDTRDDAGNRRLDDPQDFVRLEIGSALQRGIPVIPIILDGAAIPSPALLPDDIKELGLRNGLEVRHASFHNDVGKLIEELKRQFAERRAREKAEASPRKLPKWPWIVGVPAAVGVLALVALWQPKQPEPKSGVPYGVLSDMLSRVGENVSDPNDIEKKLRERLEENAALRRQLAQLANDNPQTRVLRAELSASASATQYVIAKWQLEQVHRLSQGDGIVIAVFDDGVDSAHPDLAGTVISQIGCVGPAGAHGTATAGAIAAHGGLLGIAPKAKIISVCPFTQDASPQTTAQQIIKGMDAAMSQGARIMLFNFVGPRDPLLDQAMKVASEKGIVLIAPAGNDVGPKAPPLYPAADPRVIAVTATDQNDQAYPKASRGTYIALAAPGVDILAPAPDKGYQHATGTSAAASLVTGVVALLIAQKPSRSPADIRRILVSTAMPLGDGRRNNVFGAGLVEPLKALQLEAN